MDCLKRMRDDLISDKKTIRNLVDGFREEFSTKIRESAMVQRGGDQFEILKEGAQDGNRDKALMERLEKLSQLYLGGLEEVRQDLKIMKTDCDEKLHDLESQWEKLRQQQDSYPESEDSLRQLVLDGFESRLSHLEHFLNEKENFDEEQSRVQNSIAVIEDNREQAVSALAIVTAASQKAEEFLKNILGAFHSQMMDIKQESITIQEKLLSEKEAAAATLSEVLKMRDDLRKETESTLSFLSDAKSKSIELQEGLEKESENLRNSLIATRKEKEAVLGAATAAVDQAGRLLGEISEVKRKSVHFSDEVAQALGETRKKYGEMVGGHIEECRKTMLNEISKAKEYVEVIEEEKRKSSHIVEVIKEEKRKSVCLAEAVAFREKVEFEQHKQATEMTINELAETVREMSASLDSKLQGLSQMQVHSQEQDERLKREIGDMNEKSAMLQQEVSALDDFLRKAIAEQAIIVDKVKNVEESQIDLANSVGGIQGSIAELEQSGVTWVQKYDTAARILQDIERRLSSLESASFDADKPDEQLSNVDSCHRIAPREKLQLIKLHRELSCFLQKMKSDQKIDNSFEDEWSKAFNGKIADLDNRMKHVEHDAFPKLIALEAKTEQLSTGMQTALDEASSAESKCGALGAELVKVFRMFASFQKESPTKMLGDAADEDAEQQPQHRSRCTRSHHSGSKSKLHSSNVSCTYCKKVAVKGSNDLVDCGNDHKDAECMEGNSGQNVSFEYQKGGCVYNRSNFSNMCSTREKGYKEPGPQGKPAVECREISHDRASQNEKSHQKGDLMETVHETEGSEHLLMKKNLSELKTLDGKRPAADDKRLECTKKEFTHTGSGKNCQSTNIRLATGKIHVNVSHSSSRTTKRGDTISVHP
ncbi:hypothetical protein KP509_17G058800 [Ceratopteris richardii]|nr:hypothetical protein KP509_17G058800 [Ceratopteris richardii]